MEVTVYCRVYETYPGVFHASIVAFGWEYSYMWDVGYSKSEPKTLNDSGKWEPYYLGVTTKTEGELEEHISRNRQMWRARAGESCRTFVSFLCDFLEVADLLKEVVGRLTKMGKIPDFRSKRKSFPSSFNFRRRFSFSSSSGNKLS